MGANIFLTPPQAGTPDFMMLKCQRIQILFLVQQNRDFQTEK